MKYITKLKLATSHQWCDALNKSTEFTIQFLQDSVGVDLDCVLNYLNLPDKEIENLFKEVRNYTLFFAKTFESYIPNEND